MCAPIAIVKNEATVDEFRTDRSAVRTPDRLASIAQSLNVGAAPPAITAPSSPEHVTAQRSTRGLTRASPSANRLAKPGEVHLHVLNHARAKDSKRGGVGARVQGRLAERALAANQNPTAHVRGDAEAVMDSAK